MRSYTVVVDRDATQGLAALGPPPSVDDYAAFTCRDVGAADRVVMLGGTYGAGDSSWLVLSPSPDASRLLADAKAGRARYLVLAGSTARVWAADPSGVTGLASGATPAGGASGGVVLAIGRPGAVEPTSPPPTGSCGTLAVLAPLSGMDGSWIALQGALAGSSSALAMHMWAF